MDAIFPILETFHQLFRPAKDFGEATDFLTTSEIHAMLLEQDEAMKMTKGELATWLKGSGYYSDHLEGMKMVWLLVKG